MFRIVRIQRHFECRGSNAFRWVGILSIAGAGFLASSASAAPPTWTARFNQGSQIAFARPADRESHGNGSAAYPFLGAHAVATDALGNTYVAGSMTLGNAHRDFLVEKFDATGNLVWYRTTDGGSQLDDTAFCLALSANAVFVTGESCTTGNCNTAFLTVKYDAASGAQLWAQRTGGANHYFDEAPCVAVDALGNPYVSGTTMYAPPNGTNLRDFLTIKYNGATGAEVWRRAKSTAAGSTGSSDVFGALGVGADGHVVVAGNGDGERSLLVVKYDGASGNELWTVNDTSLADTEVQSMALDSSSNPIIVGQGDDTVLQFGLPASKFLTVKYAAGTGAQAWLRKNDYAVLGPESAQDVAVDGSGNAYVTGRVMPVGVSAYSFFTVKYEALFGTELWTHTFGTGAVNDDYVPTGIAWSGATNRVVVSGYHGSPTDHDFFTESLLTGNGAGAIDVPRPVTENAAAVAVAADASGNAIVAGISSGTGSEHMVAVKYDGALSEVWAHTEPAIETNEVLGSLNPAILGRKKVAVDSLGNTVVVGSTASSASSGGDADFLIQRYGPGGDLLWSRTIDGGFGDDVATAVAVDGPGNIYVTGWSAGNGTGYDVLTMRLDPTNGNTVWSTRYDSPVHSSDVSYALTLGRFTELGGNGVFVSGASFDGAKFNATVLAYRVEDGVSPWSTILNTGGPSYAYAIAAGCQARNAMFNLCVPGIYVTGLAIDAASASSGNDFLAALVNGSDGAPVWTASVLPTGNEVGYAIAATGNPSTVVVAGSQDGDWLTAAFQGASPTPVWTVRKDFDTRDDQAYDVAFDTGGNAFVTGFATKTPARNKQVATVKYAGATGAELDASRFGPIADDLIGYGVVTDFAGNVYVAGSRFDLAAQKSDFMFLRYTNDLGLVDSDFLDSNGSDDQGTALAVERNSGDVVVAGTSAGTSAAGDFLIAKYRAPEQGLFFTTPGCRLYDSRSDARGPLAGGQARTISALGFVGACPLLTPAVKNLAINVTVVGPTAGGYLQLYPGNLGVPITTVLNFGAGQARANNAVLSLATNAAGTFAIRSGQPAGQTVHVVVDLVGYFD